MTADSVESTFTERFLSPRALESLTPAEGIELMLRFYVDEPADDLADLEMADMLLFQWGTYHWSQGAFELDITRQLIFGNGEDEDILQLTLTFRFALTEELNPLTCGNRWCMSRTGLEDVRHFILTSAPYTSVDKKLPLSVDLYYGVAG